MAQDGRHKDHRTLQAAVDLDCCIIPWALGTSIISPVESLPLYRFHIGHFAEGDGEHYVKLHNDPVNQILDVRSVDHTSTAFESSEEEGVFLPSSMKILREFYFADWRSFVVCGNKFLRFEMTEISGGN